MSQTRAIKVGGHHRGTGPSLFWIKIKNVPLFFLCVFNESILKKQYIENATESVDIDVSVK